MQEAQETQVRILDQEDPLEEGMVTHSSIPAWRILWTEESGGLQYIASQRAGHNWSNLACTQCLTHSDIMKIKWNDACLAKFLEWIALQSVLPSVIIVVTELLWVKQVV